MYNKNYRCIIWLLDEAPSYMYTTHSDIVHPPSEMQAAVLLLCYYIGSCSTSVPLENERMKLLILYTIHSGIVHSTKETRIHKHFQDEKSG